MRALTIVMRAVSLALAITAISMGEEAVQPGSAQTNANTKDSSTKDPSTVRPPTEAGAAATDNAPDLSKYLQVLDNKGKPVKTVVFREPREGTPLNLEKRTTALEKRTTEINSEMSERHNVDGLYRLPKEAVLVSAPDLGTELFTPSKTTTETAQNVVTLHPAATLTVTVLDSKGKAIKDARVSVSRNDPKRSGEALATIIEKSPVDSLGRAKFGNLGPGEYTVQIVSKDSRQRRETTLTVEPGEAYYERVRFQRK